MQAGKKKSSQQTSKQACQPAIGPSRCFPDPLEELHFFPIKSHLNLMIFTHRHYGDLKPDYVSGVIESDMPLFLLQAWPAESRWQMLKIWLCVRALVRWGREELKSLCDYTNKTLFVSHMMYNYTEMSSTFPRCPLNLLQRSTFSNLFMSMSLCLIQHCQTTATVQTTKAQ